MNPSLSAPLDRRQFLAFGAAATLQATSMGAQAQSPWNAGQVRHIIPTASHERLLLKVSLASPATRPPTLRAGSLQVPGERSDAEGRFWRFDLRGLRPQTRYMLRLADAAGAPLCDEWPLRTLPAPDARPSRLRILAYTCAGGYDAPAIAGKTLWLDMAARRRLLERGLGFEPDVVIANGDHIYWDQKTAENKPIPKALVSRIRSRFGGELDLSLPMDDPRNRAIFTAVCDYQIPGLYGTALRSTPSWFLTDDHDMFENDEYDDQVATLPVEDYGRLGAEITQRMYYPEFLPDAHRPAWLPGGDRTGMPEGANGCFGTLRYGTLLEAVLYDCRRYLDNKGKHARVVPQWVENWLVARTRAEDTAHFMHVPSLPFGYSSGKLGDWYPDELDERAGRLALGHAKEGWQPGWHSQHERLLQALASQARRSAVIVQGDFHASAVGRIVASQGQDLPHPVHTIMTGTLGTGDMGFPSAYRRVESAPSLTVRMEQALAPTEKNGFTIIDVTPERMTCSVFMWRPPQDVAEIDTMQPALVYEVPRPT